MTKPQNLDPKGIRVNVYRNAAYEGTGCTNGGVSGDHTRLTIVGFQRQSQIRGNRRVVQPLPRNCQVFEADDEAPAMVLRESNLPGCGYPPVLVPYDIARYGLEHGVGPMFGGNYAGASDSRFSDLVRGVFDCPGADLVPIHDRVETPEQYRALST